ncbi:pyrimidine (deoxy)nucleoside triphosphate diphosphatase [Erwinia phyllosphaerae]|uniref:pyrimidine (deoxy)nucleoside triphosphate diphosphatase n=1 Tax=Erwinia phyllosphaerae TaxID=2853256 RepID=UPI001FEFF705|nr:pyrimidine (deoxy)nucleoside triphosphate diphosphatase [Erwinia phyllosphaerae]MBV4365012.1 pyrimidine (deoxy)nucleoside triphosphate diphosphatase [Erwinia phyllosphaerae]
MQREIEVVAALIFRQGKLLLAQRGESGDQAGLWEFPGGKVEAEESQPQALHRELKEELGINAVIGSYIASESRTVSGRQIHLHAWLVTDFTGDLRLNCHQAFVWCLPEEAQSYDLAPADIPLLAAWLNKAT